MDDIIVCAALLALCFLAGASLVRAKRKGRSVCGCSCASCSLKDKCQNELGSEE